MDEIWLRISAYCSCDIKEVDIAIFPTKQRALSGGDLAIKVELAALIDLKEQGNLIDFEAPTSPARFHKWFEKYGAWANPIRKALGYSEYTDKFGGRERI